MQTDLCIIPRFYKRGKQLDIEYGILFIPHKKTPQGGGYCFHFIDGETEAQELSDVTKHQCQDDSPSIPFTTMLSG